VCLQKGEKKDLCNPVYTRTCLYSIQIRMQTEYSCITFGNMTRGGCTYLLAWCICRNQQVQALSSYSFVLERRDSQGATQIFFMSVSLQGQSPNIWMGWKVYFWFGEEFLGDLEGFNIFLFFISAMINDAMLNLCTFKRGWCDCFYFHAAFHSNSWSVQWMLHFATDSEILILARLNLTG
jgi:hypothetical protein